MTQTTCRSTWGRVVNRIPTCARRRGRSRRTRTVGDRSSSRSARSRHCWGTGPSRCFWTPAVDRTSMRRCGSLTRVSARRDAACGSLQRGHDARVSSCSSPAAAIEPRVGYRFGGCIRPSGSAGDSFLRKASRRGRSRAWMSTRPMTAAGTCRAAGREESWLPLTTRLCESEDGEARLETSRATRDLGTGRATGSESVAHRLISLSRSHSTSARARSTTHASGRVARRQPRARCLR